MRRCHRSGYIWFLGSTFGGAAVTRNCTVPAGKAIFFPIATVIAGAGALDCEPTGSGPCNLATLRVLAAEPDDRVTLEVRLDGKPLRALRQQRVQTPVFTLTFPANNVFDAPPGVNAPNVADGYWIMLSPLRPDSHLVYSKGVFTGPVFNGVAIEATTHLTIGP